MDNKNISSTSGYVGFIALFLETEYWFLDPIPLSELEVPIQVGKR